jgi:hypothetical protein
MRLQYFVTFVIFCEKVAAVSATYLGLVVDSRTIKVHLSCLFTRGRGLPCNFFKRVDHAVSAIS